MRWGVLTTYLWGEGGGEGYPTGYLDKGRGVGVSLFQPVPTDKPKFAYGQA